MKPPSEPSAAAGDAASRPADDSAPADGSGAFRAIACLIIATAAVLHVLAILRAEPLQSANDRSRWCTIWSLLERGTYQIDEIRQHPGWDTIDLVRVDGHFYSTKPPLMTTWVAGVVWCVCRCTGWTLLEQPQAVGAATLLFVNGVPFVLSLVLLARLLSRAAVSLPTATFVLSVAAFGTLISPFLTTLNNHTVAAVGVLVAACAWLRVATAAPRPSGWLTFATWGAAASWTACHDLPSALVTVVMAWQAWRLDRRRTLVGFLPAAALPVLAFLAANYAATGHWKPAYADYGGPAYLFVHEGVPSYWVHPQGVDRNLDSPPVYVLHCTFGHHGVFSLSPWLLLAACSTCLGGASATLPRVWVSAARWTAGLTVATLLFYWTRTQNYNYGGVSCGLRWLLFLAPLWTLSLVPALERWRSQTWFRVVAVATLAVGMVSAWQPMGRPWQQPWLFQLLDRAGWIDYYRDQPPPLARTLYTWFPSLPPADGAASWIEFESQDALGRPLRLRLEQRGDEAVGARRVAVVVATRRRGADVLEQRTLRIDRAQFAAGAPPAQCLVWTDARVTAAEQQADLAFFRGLPLLKAYHPGFVRYLKTPLRRDALGCQRAAVQVETPTADDQPARRHRCDVWLCDEVPFGVARMDWSVIDPANGATLQFESWTVAACQPPVAPESSLTVSPAR